MHIPLPFCVLAFATIGASFSAYVHFDRLLLTYVGILLALCLGAYSLDELHGRPYHTKFSDRTLWALAIIGITGGGLVGAYLILSVNALIAIPAVLALFFIPVYNLELFGGRFHNAWWFGISWGGLTTFAGYFVQSVGFSVPVLIMSVMASVIGVSIVSLTHKFRPDELRRKLETAQSGDLIAFSRYARKTAWVIAQMECYAMMMLAAAVIIPKIH